MASCTNEASERLKARVVQLVGPSSGQQQQQQTGECCICSDKCEQPFTLQGCGHKGCTECLKPMFISAANSETTYPLRCTCGVPVIMRDIISLADPHDLEKIMMQALASYKGSNLGSIFECQAVECQQVGRYPADLSVDPKWHCDVCLATYCLPCQKELLEPVLGHGGMSCQEFQEAVKAARDSADYDLAQMGDKLCKCPGCAAWVEKSTGCLHMHCSRCDEHFCWGCGETFGKGAGHTAYSHIWGCKGPRAGDAN